MDSNKSQKRRKKNLWPLWVFFLTFGISFSLSFLAETALTSVALPIAVLFLFFLIFLGIISDALAVAVTSGDEVAYNAMASKNIRGAREAKMLIKQASVISNICGDVIGDICSILSGAMGVAIIAVLVAGFEGARAEKLDMILNVLMSASMAAVMVSGKAIGKDLAMKYNKEIVFYTGKIISLFKPHGKKNRKKK